MLPYNHLPRLSPPILNLPSLSPPILNLNHDRNRSLNLTLLTILNLNNNRNLKTLTTIYCALTLPITLMLTFILAFNLNPNSIPRAHVPVISLVNISASPVAMASHCQARH